MADLPIAPMRRLAKSKDKDMRIGDEAIDKLIKVSESFIRTIAAEATDLAKYTGRKTINVQDIETVVAKLNIKL